MTKLKEKLDEIDFSFDEHHWKLLEKRLNAQRKKRFILFFLLVAGLAASGLFMYSSRNSDALPVSQNKTNAPSDTGISLTNKATDITYADTLDDRMRTKISSASSLSASTSVKDQQVLASVRKPLKSKTNNEMKRDREEMKQADGKTYFGRELMPQSFKDRSAARENNALPRIDNDSMETDLFRIGMIGLKKKNIEYPHIDTSLKKGSPVSVKKYRNELFIGRGFPFAPQTHNIESFHAQAYQLGFNRYLNPRVFVGIGLSLEFYQYSVPDYKIIYPDAVVRDQFMAYNGVKLQYTQLTSALSIGYKLNLSPKVHLLFEGGTQLLSLIKSKKEIEVTYTVEYKYADTMGRKADIERVKNDRQEQKNIGLNPLPDYQFTYFGKISLGVDVWRRRMGVHAGVEYRHLPVVGFVSKPKGYLFMPGIALYFKF